MTPVVPVIGALTSSHSPAPFSAPLKNTSLNTSTILFAGLLFTVI